MINENNDFDSNTFSSESNMPRNEAGSAQGLNRLREKLPEGTEEKFKEYGKKSLAPLIELMHKYRDDITPYASALSRGLKGAVDALGMREGEAASSADQVVAGWFREASTWFDGAKQRMEGKDAKELLTYFEEQARNSPGLMFSTSYVAGLIFGRLGRHAGRVAKSLDSIH